MLRQRVGGRTHTIRISGGRTVDVGGQWIGPVQPRVYQLAKELGLETMDQYVDGKHVRFPLTITFFYYANTMTQRLGPRHQRHVCKVRGQHQRHWRLRTAARAGRGRCQAGRAGQPSLHRETTHSPVGLRVGPHHRHRVAQVECGQ